MTYFVEAFATRLGVPHRIGVYKSGDDAVAAAKKMIDQFLVRTLRPGMDAQTLFSHYRARGEYPFIFRDDDCTLDVRGFNHIDYAMRRVVELCGA